MNKNNDERLGIHRLLLAVVIYEYLFCDKHRKSIGIFMTSIRKKINSNYVLFFILKPTKFDIEKFNKM